MGCTCLLQISARRFSRHLNFATFLQVVWTCILSKTAADKPHRAVASGNVVVPLCVEDQSQDPLAALVLQNGASQAAAV